MTAEIAIMNKDAIALAADSAVTINTGSGRKIYNTVNKLFALTKYAPVGIMVYGRADLMGVPWESIIKTYRTAIGTKTYPTLDEYAAHFISFISKNRQMFPAESQLHYFRDIAKSVFLNIRNEAQKDIGRIISKKGKAARSDVQKALEAAIEMYLKFLATKDRLPAFNRNRVGRIKRRYASVIDSAKAAVFQKIPLSSKAASGLASIPIELCARRVFSSSDSGVVIAGFGDREVFPFLRSMVFGGIVDDILRHEVLTDIKIDHDQSAVIKPFAQQEMVEAFMEGIDPSCHEVIRSYWQTILRQFPDEVARAIPSLSPVEKASLKQNLDTVGNRIFKDFTDKLIEYQREQHIGPIIDAIAVLPKDLLAEVAESLVNLTSFKRRISMTSAETVGGPIDVAVISRGDGFVWIKRKHYFKAELNPQFMSQYSGGRHASPKPPK